MDIGIPHHEYELAATVYVAAPQAPLIIFLCGGSLEQGRERFRAWQHRLQQVGVSTVAFDYYGVPGTPATIATSSLESRKEETLSVVAYAKREWNPSAIILCGVSMGGHIALMVTRELPDMFSALVLIAPAAYTASAERVLFGPTFTEMIRTTDSWSDSESFSRLASFDKPVLFISLTNDTVIPPGVTKRYLESCQVGAILARVEGSHNCWGSEPVSVKAREDICQKLTDFLQLIK